MPVANLAALTLTLALMAAASSAAAATSALPPPADWAPLIASGDMLFSGEAPPPGQYPALGNGYLGKTAGPYHTTNGPGNGNDYGSFYLAGVFSGVGNSTPIASHRAAIPDVVDVRIARMQGGAYSPLGAALDLRRGAWLNRTRVDAPGCRGAEVQHTAYAHRAERSLFVVELRAWAPPGGVWPAGGCTLALDWAINASTPDFTGGILPLVQSGDAAIMNLTTTSAEVPGTALRRVAVAIPPWVVASGGSGGVMNVTFAMDGDVVLAAVVLHSDLDADDPVAAAAADWTRLTALGADALQASHDVAVAELWTSGIELTGNLTIAAAVNSSLFYIISALREGVNYSSCPGGLATNSYHGHTFW